MDRAEIKTAVKRKGVAIMVIFRFKQSNLILAGSFELYYMNYDDYKYCIVWLKTEYDREEIVNIKGEHGEVKAKAIIDAIVDCLSELSKMPNNNFMIVDVEKIVDKVLNSEN